MSIANGLTLPVTLVNGTTNDATQVMSDFNTLLNALNRALLDVGSGSGMNAQATQIHNVADPTAAQDAATQNYVLTYLATAAYAPLASPTFTGTPTAPTPTTGDNSTRVATTAFVDARGLQSAGQVLVTATSTLSAAQAGTNIIISGSGISLTFPSTATTYSLSNTGTSAATLVFPSGTDYKTALQPGETVVLAGDGSGFWRVLAEGREGGMSQGTPIGGFTGLKISALGASNFTATITAGSVVLSSSLSAGGVTFTAKNVSVSPVISGSGANGLDTGTSSVSTWYNVFVIYNPSTSTVAGLFSLSATAPTLPSGYTYFARVGAVRTDSSGSKYLLQTLQYGRRVQYVPNASTNLTAPVTLGSGAAGTYLSGTYSPVAVSMSAAIPPTASEVEFELGCGTANTPVGAVMNNSVTYGGYSGVPPVPYSNINGGSNSACMVYRALVQSTSMYWASAGSFGYLYCLGWEDNL